MTDRNGQQCNCTNSYRYKEECVICGEEWPLDGEEPKPTIVVHGDNTDEVKDIIVGTGYDVLIVDDMPDKIIAMPEVKLAESIFPSEHRSINKYREAKAKKRLTRDHSLRQKRLERMKK